MSTRLPVLVRPCFEHDLQTVQFIYEHHVLRGTGTFETEPPDLKTMTERWVKIVASGWPYIVAVSEDDPTRIHGFAYAAQFRERAAYAQTFEDSIYVAPHAQGRGVGSILLAALLHQLEEVGAREVLAVIGDRENKASIALHAKVGFRDVGLFTGVGRKFGRWLDVVLMQRSLPMAEAPAVKKD